MTTTINLNMVNHISIPTKYEITHWIIRSYISDTLGRRTFVDTIQK